MTKRLNYSAIAKELSRIPIVGIGESTHGTHEFFEAKAEIFKILVKDYGFSAVFFEAMDDGCAVINKYIQTGNGNPEELVNKLYYVYRTKEVLDLIVWLRNHNKTHPVSFIGLDERQRLNGYLPYNIHKANLRDKNMALVVEKYVKNNPSAQCMIWAHDRHISAYETPLKEAPELSHKPMGFSLRGWFGKNYYVVAQFFGSGYFNAAPIKESGETDNSALMPHYAPKAPERFWENHLAKNLDTPTFLKGPEFAGLIQKAEAHYQRELGSGVKRSEIHEGNNAALINISMAYNAILFFPRTTASQLLG